MNGEVNQLFNSVLCMYCPHWDELLTLIILKVYEYIHVKKNANVGMVNIVAMLMYNFTRLLACLPDCLVFHP